MEMLKSKSYLQLLVLAALIGVPVSAVAYGYLALVGHLQHWFFTVDPHALGFHGTPVWWPLPLLAGGRRPGQPHDHLPARATSGHEPAEGFKTGGAPRRRSSCPASSWPSLATLSLGVVLGPEAPLIAIGGGLGVLAVKLAAKDAPPMAATVMAAAGSFAAISTLLGSPIVGAFLLMEAAGLGGPVLGLVLVPGLLAAGIGTLIFIGLDNLTGLGTFSLAIPGLPVFSHPTGGHVLLGPGHRRGGHVPRHRHPPRRPGRSRPWSTKQRLVLTPVAGLVVAGVRHRLRRDHRQERAERPVLRPERSCPAWCSRPATWTVGALVVLVVAKSIAYAFSLSGFRGGPIFPSMFIGAALGVAASHLPGMVARARGGHGHRRHGHGHAQAAPDLDPAGRPAVRQRRAERHPSGHRGRGRRLRAHAPGCPRRRPTCKPGAHRPARRRARRTPAAPAA